jgi:hypothetical protein
MDLTAVVEYLAGAGEHGAAEMLRDLSRSRRRGPQREDPV